ncbi:MAG: hypothetical protein IJL68_01395 [Bacteroidales bacterium]|nr:hypothetical protein [Bacteroidales bacterium]
MDNIVYKVLWIDDQPEIVQGYQLLAGLRNIQLIHFENWKDAQPTLDKEFGELTAIILDANCKWDTSEQAPSELFLGNVLTSLMQMFGDRHREIPWYILSAGTMTNFDTITNVLIGRERRALEVEWGATVYFKDKIAEQKAENPLFDSIIKAGQSQSNNIVLFRHRDTLKYLGEGALISDAARKILLKALAALYYPEENIGYEFAGNPLRKVLEYMFRSANRQGLLPDEFFDKKGHPVLWDSMQYMSGLEPSNIKFRYGAEGETIFPKRQNHLLLNILNFVNEDSHTGEDDDAPYVIDVESKDLFFGFLFQLLHVIKFYGQFTETHPDVEANKAKKQKIQTAADLVVGKEGIVLAGPRFNYMGTTELAYKLGCRPGQKVRIDEAVLNTGSNKDQYPTYATKVTIL